MAVFGFNKMLSPILWALSSLNLTRLLQQIPHVVPRTRGTNITYPLGTD